MLPQPAKTIADKTQADKAAFLILSPFVTLNFENLPTRGSATLMAFLLYGAGKKDCGDGVYRELRLFAGLGGRAGLKGWIERADVSAEVTEK